MLSKISDLIVDVARKEDLVLRRVGKGVLLIPELAFTYAVGREIASNAEAIFGTDEVIWKPETKLSQESGRTDLVFDVKGNSGVAIEFKIGGHKDSYIKDIEKLRNIPGNYEKIFCALIDAWATNLQDDSRVQAVNEQKGIEPICRDKFFDFFASLHGGYSGQVCCIVGVWHIQDSR
jgi:hypothetical protein